MKIFITFLLGTLVMSNTLANGLEGPLDKVIETAINEKRIMGTVIVVAKDGKVIYRKATGLDDVDTKKKLTVETPFRLASLSKSIVSVAALKLIEAKKLSFSDPVTKWLPNFKPKLNGSDEVVITIENLMNHTSGLTYPFLEPADSLYRKLEVSDGLSDTGITLSENMNRLSKTNLIYKPGSSWMYSLSIDVLGAVIEKVTGKDLEASIRELVTSPLKMNETMFVVPKSTHLAIPYANTQTGPVKMTDPYTNFLGEAPVLFSPSRAYNKDAFPSGGSGMSGTADDFILFLEALRTGSFLKETQNRLFENTTKDYSIILAGPGWGWGVASALLIDPKAANMPMSKNSLGWSGAYGHTWWLDKDNGMSVVILTNTSFEGMAGKFPEEVRAAVYKELVK